MSAVEVIPSFDWEQFSESDRLLVERRRSEICGFMRSSVYAAVEIGLRLFEIKQCLKTSYRDWIAAEFPWGQSAAYRFEAVANRFGHLAKTAPIWERFEVSALYELATTSTPPEVVDEALTLAESGQDITHRCAKQLKAKTYQPPLKAGQSVEVKDTRSPYAGQTVEVKTINRQTRLATCATPAGEVELLLDELNPGEEPNSQRVGNLPAKPASAEAVLATELQIERARVEVLEKMLARVCEAARARKLTASLLVEAEELIL